MMRAGVPGGLGCPRDTSAPLAPIGFVVADVPQLAAPREGAETPARRHMAKRAVIRLQLDLAAKQQLDRLCEKRGMTQISVLSRLVKWFGRQDEFVQASVLGLLSEEMLGGLSHTLLKRLAAKHVGGHSNGHAKVVG